MKLVKPGYLLTESLMAILIVGFSLGAFLALQGTLIKMSSLAKNVIQESIICKSSMYTFPKEDERKLGYKREETDTKASYEILRLPEKSAFKDCKRCGLVEMSYQDTDMISFIFLTPEKEEKK